MGVEQLYSTARRLQRLHREDGLSWRKIAKMAEFRGISHTTLRDIANGHEPSAETYKALGIRKSDSYAVAFHLHDESTAVALRRIFDRYGRNRREVAEKLVSGELRIVEIE